MRAAWRRELDHANTTARANNHLCPICECHVWTHAPGESYTVFNGSNYHPACLKAEGIDAESGQPRNELTAPTAGRQNEPAEQMEATCSEGN